jgi:C-terminal processing protease CtpA/Prc
MLRGDAMNKRILIAGIAVLAALAFISWRRVPSEAVNADLGARVAADEQAQTSQNTKSLVDDNDQKELAEFLTAIGPAKSTTGMTVMPTFLVKGVEPGSPADIVGLKEGDLIVNIDGHQTDSFKVLLRMTRKEPGTPVTMDVLRYNPDIGKRDHYKTTMPLAARR